MQQDVALQHLPDRARKRESPCRAQTGVGAPLIAGRATVLQRDLLFRRALAGGDALAAIVAVTVAADVGGGGLLLSGGAIVAVLAVLVNKLSGLYDRDELLLNKTTLDEAPALFQVATLVTLLTWLLEVEVTREPFGRPQVLILLVAMFVGSMAARAAARMLAHRLVEPERCLVVGAPRAARALTERLGELNADLVGELDLDLSGDRELALQLLREAVIDRDVHRVILAPESADSQDMLDSIRMVKSVGVKVSVLPRLLEVIGSSVVFDDLGGLTVLGVRRFGLSRSSAAVKRALDVAVAAGGLLAVLPFVLAAALAVRLDSRGPVFFRQIRVGRNGERFEMLKFRTMVDGADAMKAELGHLNEAGGGLFKIADDPRITRVGRALRKTSLDEMPQLLNVLRGDMSLVGPRPLVVDEDSKVVGMDRRRLHLTPGMTGQWQILGSARVPLQEMVKIDYLYAANWSFWTDLKIMVRTVPCMLRRQGQ